MAPTFLSELSFPGWLCFGQELHDSAVSQRDGQNTDLNPRFQTSLFVYLALVLSALPSVRTGRLPAKTPRATCFTKSSLLEVNVFSGEQKPDLRNVHTDIFSCKQPGFKLKSVLVKGY